MKQEGHAPIRILPLSDKFTVEVVPNPHRFSPLLEASLDEVWAKAPNSHFNGKIFCVKEIQNDCIKGYFIDYRYLYGMRQGLPIQLSPIGVTAAVMKEGSVLIGKRSQNVGSYQNYWEFVPAGSLDPVSIAKADLLHPELQLLVELKEEAGIEPHSILNLTVIGLLYSDQDRTFDILYKVVLKEGSEQLAFPSHEHDELHFATLNECRKKMQQHVFVPIAELIMQQLP